MGTGTSTSLLLTDFQDLPIAAQERLRQEYEICRSDGMEEEEVFYSLERSLMDEVTSRLQALRVYSQQTSQPEGSTPEGGSVGSHDSNVGSISSIGQLSALNSNPQHPKQRSKSNKIPGRSHQSKSSSPSEHSHGLFPPLLPTSPQSCTTITTTTTTTGQQRFWEGEYLNEIEEDASYLEDTINRRVHTIRSKNERLLQKKTAAMHQQYSGDRTTHNHHNLNHHTSEKLIVSNANNTHYSSNVSYSISPLKPHLHPYDQMVEVGWKRVAEGLR